MKLKDYIISLETDKGIINIQVCSFSQVDAIKKVLIAENAPLAAVRKVQINKVITLN